MIESREEIDDETIGVSIDGPVAYAAAQKKANQDEFVVSSFGGSQQIPAAILLPRFPSEPFRMDIGKVPHPRGCGASWPSEAIVDSGQGAGRFPLCLALEKIRSGEKIKWEYEESRAYDSSNAVAGGFAEYIATANGKEEFVFVIPNHWGEALQQEIIDSFQKYNLRVKLLWRPVAAAFEWCSANEKHLKSIIRGGETDQTLGNLLSIHLGLDEIEVTEIELVAREFEGKMHIVPGRRRPNKNDRIVSFGYRLLLDQLENQMVSGLEKRSTDAQHYSELWKRLWCTSFINKTIVDSKFTINRYFAERESDSGLLCGTDQAAPSKINSELSKLGRRLQRKYDGIVVTGTLAEFVLDDQRSFLQWIQNSLNVRSTNVLIEGRTSVDGVLARGASQFATKLLRNVPTYLDTLPRLEMVISEKGEPCWIDLLDPAQKWVDGGKAWTRPELISNLSIPAGNTDLKLAVAHEEFLHVREVITMLPNASDTTEKISLSVQIVPAQGKARIELHPEHPEIFDNERVFVDWRRMEVFENEQGKQVGKEGYLNSLPRIFPELLPRIQSQSKWLKVQPKMQEVLNLMNSDSSREVVSRKLAYLRGLLRDKDQSKYPQDATAFDSEGNCPGVGWDQRMFMKTAWDYFSQNEPREFVRAMAYTSTDHPKFAKLILDDLASKYPGEEYVVAAGKCLRKPKHISNFVKALFREYETTGLNMTWWKALSETLRFRPDATKLITLEGCESLMNMAGDVFSSERRRGSGGQLFRLACLVIVYILRKRAFEDSFLDPESELAVWVKSEFKKAQADARSGRLRLMGGSIDLSQQLQLIIDYVDRQGKGQLLMGG